MAVTSNPLIEVDFRDSTANLSVASTEDVLATVVDASWGPVGYPVVATSEDFQNYVNPTGAARINESYANVLSYFAKGGRYVEFVRLTANEKVVQFTLSVNDASAVTSFILRGNAVPYSENWEDMPSMQEETGVAVFRMRYPGSIPGAILILPYTFSGTNKSTVPFYRMYFGAFTPTTDKEAPEAVSDFDTLYEDYVFCFDPTVSQNGVSMYYADVINAQSSYFTADPNVSPAFTDQEKLASMTYKSAVDVIPSTTPGEIKEGRVNSYYTAEDYANAYAMFGDRDTSRATMIAQPLYASVLESDPAVKVQTAIINLAATRMDLNALVGSASGVWVQDATQTVANAKTYFGGLPWDMFSGCINAQERYAIGTQYFLQDGSYGWAGRIAATAASLSNRNQLPSYKAYGQYPGVITKSLTFKNVVDLHEEGIGSIYKTATTNYIFNIQSMYTIRTSYFGKLNVMRVTAAVLRNTFDLVEMAIHTGVAADPTRRAVLQAQLNSMLGDMAARGEIRNQSNANCGSALNTDTLTKNGKVLNILLEMWYIGLTERVLITVQATDTTTTATLTEG